MKGAPEVETTIAYAYTVDFIVTNLLTREFKLVEQGQKVTVSGELTEIVPLSSADSGISAHTIAYKNSDIIQGGFFPLTGSTLLSEERNLSHPFHKTGFYSPSYFSFAITAPFFSQSFLPRKASAHYSISFTPAVFVEEKRILGNSTVVMDCKPGTTDSHCCHVKISSVYAELTLTDPSWMCRNGKRIRNWLQSNVEKSK